MVISLPLVEISDGNFKYNYYEEACTDTTPAHCRVHRLYNYCNFTGAYMKLHEVTCSY